jgi:hypothetical protein
MASAVLSSYTVCALVTMCKETVSQAVPTSDPQDPHRNLYDVDNPSTIISMTDWYQQYSEQLAGKRYRISVADGAETYH